VGVSDGLSDGLFDGIPLGGQDDIAEGSPEDNSVGCSDGG